MKTLKLKNGVFLIIITLSLVETTFHIHSLLKGLQPSRKTLFTNFLLLAPNMLVYDRPLGFFSKLNITFFFADKSPPISFDYKEKVEDSNNYLEQILQRKMQLHFWNKNTLDLLSKYFLCKKKIKSFAKLTNSQAVISEVNLKLVMQIEKYKHTENSRIVKCQK